MITKDEITMYICSYGLFLKEMLMFRYTHINTCSTNWMLLNTHMNANIHLVMNSFGTLFHDKIFSLTFPWLLTTSLTFPWHVPNSLTFPGFPDKWWPWQLHLVAVHWLLLLLLSTAGPNSTSLGFHSQANCQSRPNLLSFPNSLAGAESTEPNHWRIGLTPNKLSDSKQRKQRLTDQTKKQRHENWNCTTVRSK